MTLEKADKEKQEVYRTDGGLFIEMIMEKNGLWHFNCKNGYTPSTIKELKFTSRTKASKFLEGYLLSRDRLGDAEYPNKPKKKPSPPLRNKNSKAYKEWEAKYGESESSETVSELREGSDN